MNTTYDRLALLVLGLMLGVALAAPTPTTQTKGQDPTALTKGNSQGEQPSSGLGVGP
jgi:hypothetical protein